MANTGEAWPQLPTFPVSHYAIVNNAVGLTAAETTERMY